MTDENRILWAIVVCIVSFALMILAQTLNPTEGLNAAGCLFAVVWLTSGIYAAMGALFTWL